MDRRTAWVLGIIFGGLFLLLIGFVLIVAIAIHGDGHGGFGSGERVGIVEIRGQIADSKKVLKDLREFRDADSIKAIVVRIDSPGGAVGPSQEIYEAIRSLRGKKTVVASMGSVAASGGFYIASAAEKVYANPGTLTGSIGVIFQMPNVQGVLRWAGVQMNVLTAGKMKDSGSPFREMTPEDRAYFEGLLQDVHHQFIQAVAQGRGLKVEDVQPYADGRVFTGRQAKEWRLVDELGGIQEAVAKAGELAGIKGEPKMEYPRREKKLLRELFGDEADTLFEGASTALSELGGGLQYRLPLYGGGP